jgi:hydroxymethylglutaryl-CoA lyase
MRGAERAVDCKVDEINLVMSASETHNLANTRMTRLQSRSVLSDICRKLEGQVAINISISTAFGCPMEGHIPVDEVLAIGDWFAFKHGVRGITLCDTTGMANPAQVERICDGLVDRWRDVELTLHFHNTRGMGLANVIPGISAGIVRYDASLAGLGGCPYAPGATGNISSEDLVHMLQVMGCDTDIDLDALLECAMRMPRLVQHGVPGHVLQAGRSSCLHPVPADLEQIRIRALARD